METIKLRDEYIKLGQALKAAGLCESGVDAKYAIDSANYALSHPQTEFDSSADAEMYIQNLSDRLEYAKQRVEEFRQAFSGAKKTLEGDVS